MDTKRAIYALIAAVILPFAVRFLIQEKESFREDVRMEVPYVSSDPGQTEFTWRLERITLWRHGHRGSLMHVAARTLHAEAAGFGWAHAHDRLTQMIFVRTICQGRLAELVKADNDTLAADRALRALGFATEAEEAYDALRPATRAWFEAYAAGVNEYIGCDRYGRHAHAMFTTTPLELLLVGLDIECWRAQDSLALIRFMGYVGLTDVQSYFEKTIVEMIQSDVSVDFLAALFPILQKERSVVGGTDQPALEDAELLAALRDVYVEAPVIPAELLAHKSIGSNNWAVAGSRTRSGKPIAAYDPHLQTSRLPAFFYEATSRVVKLFASELDGIVPSTAEAVETTPSFSTDLLAVGSIPGCPGPVFGRLDWSLRSAEKHPTMSKKRGIAFGMTFGFSDQIDYIVETIDWATGRSRVSEGTWAPLLCRATLETPKGGASPPMVWVYPFVDTGRIEVPPLQVEAGSELFAQLADELSGFQLSPLSASLCASLWPRYAAAHNFGGKRKFLSQRTSFTNAGVVSLADGLHRVRFAQTAAEAIDALKPLALSGNWIVTDTENHMAFQQSAAVPKRPAGVQGVLPVLRERSASHWTTLRPASDLVRVVDPPSGFLFSANNEVARLLDFDAARAAAHQSPITANMGEYRSDRVLQLLEKHASESNDQITTDMMKSMHRDTFCLRAQRFLAHPDVRGALDRIGSTAGEGALQHAWVDAVRQWDGTYESASVGAALFHRLYLALLAGTTGRVIGPKAWAFLAQDTVILADFFHYFDDFVLMDDEKLFLELVSGALMESYGGGLAQKLTTRTGVFETLLAEEMAAHAELPRVAWGEQNTFTMNNIVLGGQLPLGLGKLLGVDVGPVPLAGSAATVRPGNQFREHGRPNNWGQSLIVVADMADAHLDSALPGGPSGRPFSGMYSSGLDDYTNGVYKSVRVPKSRGDAPAE